MTLIEILKKLNIIRAGSVSGTYKNAKDRPMALQDDMFLGKPEPGVTPTRPHKAKTTKPSRNFLIVSIILALIMLLLALTTTIAWLVILIWIAWVIYVWFLYTGKITYVRFSLMLTLVVLFIVSFFFVLLTQTDSAGSNNSATKKLTSAECKPYYDKYNNKVLNISSDGLQGTIGIKIDMTSGCKLTGWYNVLLSQNIAQNPYKRDVGPSYHYIVMLREADQTTRDKYDDYGSLAAVYKNHTKMPGVFDDSVARSKLYSQGVNATSTRYFSWGYKIDTDFSEKRYQEIFKQTKLEIVDGLSYIEEDQDSSGGYSYGINHDKAAVSGKIVKTYNLTIEE